MQFFNTALAHTMSAVHARLLKRGFVAQEQQWVVCYVDDALVGSNKPGDHLEVLKETTRVLEWHGWTLNVNKRQWGVKEIDFLGYRVSAQGIKPSNNLIEKLSDLQQPHNKQQLRELFRLCLQLLSHQYCQHDILSPQQDYKQASPKVFRTDEFERIWRQVISTLQKNLWLTNPW